MTTASSSVEIPVSLSLIVAATTTIATTRKARSSTQLKNAMSDASVGRMDKSSVRTHPVGQMKNAEWSMEPLAVTTRSRALVLPLATVISSPLMVLATASRAHVPIF